MKGTAQIVKGRIKEAVGALSGNDELRAKGLTDQAVGHVKEASAERVRQVKGYARKITSKARDGMLKDVD